MGGERERDLDRESHYGIRERSAAKESPKNPQGRLELRLLVIVWSVPELAFPVIRLLNTPPVIMKPSSSNG